ncbi:hypothetical protein V1525DRAFT_403754 [Lipomyces kononenkoae]|uniref:Uncharacterized protein n=1 Tax=Lipomyces kononenkoae TaxID=34357 RepID=A0ACC3T0W2_LIPKO
MTELSPQPQSRATGTRVAAIEESASQSVEDLDLAGSRDSRHSITTPNDTGLGTPRKEQLLGTRNASPASPPEKSQEPTHSPTSSRPSCVPNSKTTAPKRSSIRAFFTRSSVVDTKTPSTLPPTSSATRTNLPDFSTTDAAHIYSYYKKLPYSTAILDAVAVDSLACNAHGSLLTKLSKTFLDVRTFVLLPHAILRYAQNTSSTAVPEQVLVLSAESVAYASDDIAGQQFVLRISERPEPHQVEEKMSVHCPQDDVTLVPKKFSASPSKTGSTSSRRSIFFHRTVSSPALHDHNDSMTNHHHEHNHHHHISLLKDEKTRTMLLVFDSAAEFMRWLDLTHSQIKLHRDSLHNNRYDPLDSEMHEFDKAEDLAWRFPRFDGSDGYIQRSGTNLSVAEINSSSVPSSKRPSVASISSSTASQSSQPLSPLSAARRNSASSVQSIESLGSSRESSSLSSLRVSLNAFSLQRRPPPAARRESTTFAGLTRLASFGRIPSHQRQPIKEVPETAAIDGDGSDGISSASGSVAANVARKKRIKMKNRSPPGPPPSRPLPPIPTEQN